MKWASVAVLLAAAVEHSWAATETFFFTQCECPAATFASVSSSATSLVSSTLVQSTSGLISCFDTLEPSGTFPGEPGLILNLASTVNRFLFGTTKPALLSTAGGVTDTPFFFVGQFDMESEGLIETSLLTLLDGSTVLLDIKLLVTDVASLEAIDRNSQSSGQAETNFSATQHINIVAGIFKAGTNFGPFACMGSAADFSDLDCVRRSQIGGSFSVPTSDLTARFFRASDGNTKTITTKGMQLGTGTFTSNVEAVIKSSAVSVLTAFQGTINEAAALPSNPQTSFALDEDDDTQTFNLFTAAGGVSGDVLALSFAEGSSFDGTASLAGNILSYKPAADFFGSDAFTYSYAITSPYTCARTVSAEFDVAGLADAPVAVSSEIRVFAGVTKNIATISGFSVGTDADNANDAFIGTMHIDNVAELTGSITVFTSGGNCNSATALPANGNVDVTAANGALFCYTPTNEFLSESSETLEFTLTDGGGLFASGTITFIGQNPVAVADTEPSYEAAEGGSVAAVLSDFGQIADGANIQFVVIFLTKPAAGTLLVGTATSGVEVSYGDTSYSTSTVITYVPDSGYFNADQNGEGRDLLNALIGSCSSRSSNEVCTDDFNYQVTSSNGEINGGTGSGHFVVTAVNSGSPSVTAAGSRTLNLNSADASGSVIRTSLDGVTFSNDAGSNIFQMGLQLIGVGGVTFLTPTVTGVFVSDTDVATDSCSITACGTAILLGAPARLQALIEDMEIRVPAEADTSGDDAALTFEVGASNDDNEFDQVPDVRFEFVVTTVDSTFFDDTNNIIIVGASGGAFLALVVLLGVYKIISSDRMVVDKELISTQVEVTQQLQRNRKQREKERAAAAATKVTQQPQRPRKQREKERAAAAATGATAAGGSAALAKGGIEDADDEIFDWEKHIDKNTRETYFFNPRTGESRWDLPSGASVKDI